MNHGHRALETEVRNVDFILGVMGRLGDFIAEELYLVCILKESLWPLWAEWVMGVRTEAGRKQ